MKSVYIILNPVAGRGFSRKTEPAIYHFWQHSNRPFKIVHTEYVGHGIELAQKAAMDGWKLVVAAGGDGTTNEVINGLMKAHKNGHHSQFGCIPTGSGSDFAFNAGVPVDIQQALQRLLNGQPRKLDLGLVSIAKETPRYFDNQLGIGFDGIVTLEAKKFTRLRGMALYLPVVLKTVFITQQAIPVHIKLDDQTLSVNALQISVANGAREGGGFYMTPAARMDDGMFDILILRDISKWNMLKLIPHFTKGTHDKDQAVSLHQTTRIEIHSEADMIAHIDGEVLCTNGHTITCDIIPKCLDIIC